MILLGGSLCRGMDGSGPSPELIAANERLYALRAAAQAQRQAVGTPPGRAAESASSTPAVPRKTDDTGSLAQAAEKVAALPEHLGWGSAALTAVLRRRRAKPAQRLLDAGWLAERGTPAPSAEGPETPAGELEVAAANLTPAVDWVKHYPDIGLGMLRKELTAPGRLWLLLRYLDQEGRGVLRIVNSTPLLTSKSSATRLCGKRQLRNLLREGEGIFWTRDKEHLWLRSAAKVAYALGVTRLSGRPVALPLSVLLEGIGTFRAHLYTAFHSGRTKETRHGEQAMPIARQTLAGLSGVGRSSQRAYEQQVGLAVRTNYAVAEVAQKERTEERAWQHGRALFMLTDYRGRQGRKGRTYLAWQLPNTYMGPHPRRPRGRQRRINRALQRKLKDLVTKGTPGNEEQAMGPARQTPGPQKAYYPTAKLAVKAYGRDPAAARYWQWQATQYGRAVLWQQLGGD